MYRKIIYDNKTPSSRAHGTVVFSMVNKIHNYTFCNQFLYSNNISTEAFIVHTQFVSNVAKKLSTF